MSSQLAKQLASIRPVWRFAKIETDANGCAINPERRRITRRCCEINITRKQYRRVMKELRRDPEFDLQ